MLSFIINNIGRIRTIIGGVALVFIIIYSFIDRQESDKQNKLLDQQHLSTIGWINNFEAGAKNTSRYVVKFNILKDSIISTAISGIKHKSIGSLYVIEYYPDNPEINRVRLDRKVRRPDWYKDRQLHFQYNGAIARGVITKVEDMQYAGSLVTFTFRAENDSIYNVEEWVVRREYQIGDSVKIRYITLYPRSSYIINDSIPQ